MALGFKKFKLPKGEDLAMMGGAGLAALGGPIAPLILAAMYKGSREGADDEADAIRAHNMQREDVAELSRRAESGNANYQGPRTLEGQLFGRQAMSANDLMTRVDPESALKRADRTFNPAAPEDYTLKPGESRMRGSEVVASLPGEAPAVGPRGWFRDRKGKVFQAHENAPGTRANLERGEWALTTEPNSGQGVADQFQRETGGAVQPGTMPVRGQNGWELVPMPGSDKDPAMIEANRMKTLQAEAPGARAALDTTSQFYDKVLEEITKIENDPNTTDVVGAYEGSGEPWGLNPLSAQGNSTAFTNIDNLQNMLQVQGLQMMRDASKTGGAVGSVTEREWPKLSARFGNLNRRQDENAFGESLKSIKAGILEAKQRAQEVYTNTYDPQRGAQPSQAGGGAPQGARDYVGFTPDGKRVYVENGQQFVDD